MKSLASSPQDQRTCLASANAPQEQGNSICGNPVASG